MKEEEQQKKQDTLPRTREMQETINHLILGITMWISTSVTCLTTLLSVHQPWCLIALILPFVYTMFPQIQKFAVAVREAGYLKYKARKEEKEETKLLAIQEKQEIKQVPVQKVKKEKVPVSFNVKTEEVEEEKVEVQL